MIELLWTGFLLGLLGSLHCLGMCGPLAVALPRGQSDHRWRYTAGRGLYNLGRIITYTVLGGGRIAPDPAWVRTNIRTETVPILGRVTCHRAVLPQLRAALGEIAASGLASTIHPDEYAGCYYPRFIAGTTSLSLHSFGIALDLNTPTNQRGTAGDMDRRVVAIFKKWGFAWGGDWRYTDPMHFEMNAVVTPR